MRIKQLLAGGLAALAAGATLDLGVGALTLGDFVQVTGNTMTSPYLVIGANAAAEDTLAAADVGVALAGHATKDATIPGTSSVSATGGVIVTSDLNKSYIGKNLDYVMSTMTFVDLPDTLQTLTFTDLNATTITYSQRIDLGAVAPQYSKPSGETEPALHIPLTTSTSPFNMTLNFIGGLDSSAVDTSYKVTMFGKEFTFGPTHLNHTLELYSTTGASTVVLSGVTSEEEVDVSGTSHTFKIVGWGQETSPQGIYLTINGQAPSPAEWREGSTYTIPGTTTKVYVNDVSIMSLGAQEKTVSVQLFVGTDKIKMENSGNKISMNDQTVDSKVFFDSTVQPKINGLTFQIFPSEDTVLREGIDFVDPIFGAITMALKGMTPDLTAADRDLIKLTSSSTQMKLTFTNKDGNTYTEIPVMYSNSSGYFRMRDSTYRVYTQECNGSINDNQIAKGDYFVVTSGDYSYMLKYDNYNIDASDPTKNYVTLTDLSTSTQYKVYLDSGDKNLRIGSLQFFVRWSTGGSSGKKLCVKLDGPSTTFTKGSVNIKTQSGQIIALAQTDAEEINITETPLYTVTDANDPTAAQLNVTVSYSASGGVTFTPVPSMEQLGSDYEWKDITDYGTYVYSSGDSNGKKTVSYYIPGNRPAPVNIAVGSAPVIGTSASAGGTIQEAVQIKNSISKMEGEVVTATLDRDLVLIGGPCANSLVAELLNMSSTSPACSTEFVALYPNEGVIKIVEDAFVAGKKALIVAGVDRAATRTLAESVMQGTVDYAN